MKCPGCTHVNAPDARFCIQCGRMLGNVCPGCGAVNPAQGRFCSQCGAELAAGPFAEAEAHPPVCQPEERRAFPRAAAGERKHVTVLFSDMSGYTALTQRLDPEEVREIMARLTHEITRVVARYEGFIEKFAGDAVMAVFGAIQAHEDDAIRAIIAAREIHERVAAYSRHYEEAIGQRLAMHSGINTGLVVTGDVDFEAGTHGIAGAPLNIASRLCALAGPGEILVGDDTYRHALGYFNFLALEPVAVKGVDTPVRIYRVVSLIDRPQKIHRFHGLRADLIGRSPELTTLSEALDRVRAGHGRLVTICGTAGTGKSRLVEEFRAVAGRAKVHWREGQCYPYSRNFTYFPFIDLLNRTLGIEGGDPAERVRAKIEAGLDFVDHREEVVPYVGRLYNFDYPQLTKIGPETWRQRLQKAILDILTAMSRRAPTIICLEDLHWADPSSLELIRFLLSDFRYPALVILVYRPTLSLLSHQETENLGESYLDIRLEDLSPAETEAMVGSLLKSQALPAELKRFVRDKAGGNPFYLEEIINSLVESGTLSPEKEGWVLLKTISEARISATVHGVIAARVDRLEPAVKCILQEAAVIGRAFSHDILCRITDCETDLWHHLGSLETLDIIKARSFRPSVEYIFKHALTQEVVYGGLVTARRQAIHERVARVLEELYADRLPESYEALAYHFQRGASPDKAVTYLAASGAKSLGRYALEEAHRYYQSAYDWIGQHFSPPESDRKKIELINQWAFVHYYRGRYEELLQLLSDHRKSADRLSDDKTRGMFHAWLGCALWHRERFREAHQTLLTALSLAKEKEDMAFVGYASCWLAWVCSELGLLDEALAHAAKAQEIHRAGGSDNFIYFSSVAARGYALWHKGEMAETAKTGEMLLKFGRENGDYRAKGMGYCCLGWSALIGGEIPDACRFFEKAVLVSVDPWYAIFPKLALAYGLMVNGRVHEAKRQIAEGEAFCKEFGAEFGGQPARFFKGVILVGEGRVEEGLSLLEECCRNWRQNGSKLRFAAFGAMLAGIYSELYRKARAGGQAELTLCAQKQATAYFQDAVESAAEIGAKGTLARAYRAWGRFYQEQGDSDQARGCLTAAAAYFRSCGVEALARQAEEDQRALEEDPGAGPAG